MLINFNHAQFLWIKTLSVDNNRIIVSNKLKGLQAIMGKFINFSMLLLNFVGRSD